MIDLLPAINVALQLGILAYAVRLEHRLTRIEGFGKRLDTLEQLVIFRRRSTDEFPTLRSEP